MSDTYYVPISWTSGDTITEARKDQEQANSRAVDAMAQGIEFIERSAPSTPGANKVHVYAKDKGGVPTLYAINDAGTEYELAATKPTFLFTITGTLATGTNLTPVIPVHRALTIVRAFAVVKTGPTGADLIFDINKNATSIWASTPANRLKITDGNTTGSQTNFDTTALALDDQLTIDIDQVGSTISGVEATVSLKCE